MGDFSDYVNGVMTKYKNKLDNVCKTVLKHTVQRAKACFGEGSYDDATLITVALRPQLFEIGSEKKKKNEQKDSMEESKEESNEKEKDNDEKEELSVKGLDDDEEEE